MVFVFGLGMIFVAALVVSLPLFRGETAGALGGDPESHYHWEKQKRDAYAAIKEADLDFQMGKLTRADYDLIRRAQEARAVEAIGALDRGGEVRDQTRSATQPATCPACGGAVDTGAFCAACGAAVTA